MQPDNFCWWKKESVRPRQSEQGSSLAWRALCRVCGRSSWPEGLGIGEVAYVEGGRVLQRETKSNCSPSYNTRQTGVLFPLWLHLQPTCVCLWWEQQAEDGHVFQVCSHSDVDPKYCCQQF